MNMLEKYKAIRGFTQHSHTTMKTKLPIIISMVSLEMLPQRTFSQPHRLHIFILEMEEHQNLTELRYLSFIDTI